MFTMYAARFTVPNLGFHLTVKCVPKHFLDCYMLPCRRPYYYVSTVYYLSRYLVLLGILVRCVSACALVNLPWSIFGIEFLCTTSDNLNATSIINPVSPLTTQLLKYQWFKIHIYI